MQQSSEIKNMSHEDHSVALISVFLFLSQTPVYTAKPRMCGYCITWCVSAFTGAHCTYPRKDGQAELTWNM